MRAPVALTLGADGVVVAEPGACGEATLGAVGYAMRAAAHTVEARGAGTAMPRAA